MSISDYIIQFEQLYTNAKSHKMEILNGVLAYRLLNSANLSEHHKQLVRATVTDMKYSAMKDQLKKYLPTQQVHHISRRKLPLNLNPLYPRQ